MKKLFTFIIGLLLITSLQSQIIVSTASLNKMAVLEEFTGTGCPNCPAGHTEAANILASNPYRVIVIAYHPANSSYTSSDPMASSYATAFYTTPYISSGNRFMPSATINRRAWNGGDRIQSRGDWSKYVTNIISEPSPLNVGVSSEYNEGTKELTITSEVYFTDDVTDGLTFYCMIIESGIVANQQGGTSPYTHNHVFRKALVAQWGDPISTPTTTGELKTLTFTYDNSTSNYDIDQCEIAVLVRNAANEEIISGNIAPIGETSPMGVAESFASAINISVYPNPVTESSIVSLTLDAPQQVNLKVVSISGKVMASYDLGTIGAGTRNVTPDILKQLPSGAYMIMVQGAGEPMVQKVLIAF